MTVSISPVMALPGSYLPPPARSARPTTVRPVGSSSPQFQRPENFQGQLEQLLDNLAGRGFTFEPWQVAAFVTAIRTKPFVILAGISGTGKTKLPRLVADATDATCVTVPVRPDWTDSSDLLGYQQITGEFHAGDLLRCAAHALQEPERQFLFVLDEMNIARVEYYFAEVLSRLEERRMREGRLVSDPLVPTAPTGPEHWDQVGLPANLCLVGSVNMDETTFGFSKKVLDRAFVIEFSTIDLSVIEEVAIDEPLTQLWSSTVWATASLSLAHHPDRADPEVRRVISALLSINDTLALAQLQVGYRVRDEIAMFCLAAQDCAASFTTRDAGTVDPLDLAIAMKILPRVQGAGTSIRKVLEGLSGWAAPASGAGLDPAEVGSTTGFPFCAARLGLMTQRLQDTGYTSYWL